MPALTRHRAEVSRQQIWIEAAPDSSTAMISSAVACPQSHSRPYTACLPALYVASQRKPFIDSGRCSVSPATGYIVDTTKRLSALLPVDQKQFRQVFWLQTAFGTRRCSPKHGGPLYVCTDVRRRNGRFGMPREPEIARLSAAWAPHGRRANPKLQLRVSRTRDFSAWLGMCCNFEGCASTMRLRLDAERRRSVLQFGLSGAPVCLGGALLVVWLVKRRRGGRAGAQPDRDADDSGTAVQDEVSLPPSRQHPRSCTAFDQHILHPSKCSLWRVLILMTASWTTRAVWDCQGVWVRSQHCRYLATVVIHSCMRSDSLRDGSAVSQILRSERRRVQTA